jgi:ankyrin repeat protein
MSDDESDMMDAEAERLLLEVMEEEAERLLLEVMEEEAAAEERLVNLIEKWKEVVNDLWRQGRPLHYAAKYGKVDLIKLLLQRREWWLDVNLPDRRGETALHWALRANQSASVFALLQSAKIDVDRIHTVGGMSALQVLAMVGTNDYAVVQALVGRSKDLNQRMSSLDFDEETLLLLAIGHTNGPLTYKLLREDTVDVNLTNNNGKTALMFLCETTFPDERMDLYVARRLVRRGVDVNARTLSIENDADASGDTALFFAAEGQNLQLATYLVEECGADVNVLNKYGRRFFEYADDTDMFFLMRQLWEDSNARRRLRRMSRAAAGLLRL